MGDFNSNVLRNTRYEAVANVNDSDQGRKLTNVLRKFALTNVIKQPTRITETTKTLIDLSIISDRNKVVKEGVFNTYIADHRLIYTVLKLSKARVPPVIRSVVDWKNCNQDTFRQQVAFIPWYACNVFDDIDDNYWMENALYQDIKLELLPERKAKVRSKSLSWMNCSIRKLMNQRYQQLLKAQRTGSSEDRLNYKELRNKVIKALRSAEAEDWTNMLSTTSKGSRDF